MKAHGSIGAFWERTMSKPAIIVLNAQVWLV